MNRFRIFSVVVLVMAAIQTAAASSSTATLSDQAIRAIPDVLRRMRSDDATVRAALVDELVVVERDHDVIRHVLRYEIADNDYSIILQNTLAGLASELPPDRKVSGLFWKVEVICKTRQLTAVDVVVAEFAANPDGNVSRRAVDLLVEMKSHLATPYLASRLRTEDPLKLHGALHGIVAVGAVETVPRITELMNHPSENSRHWAVWALFNLDARDRRDDIYRTLVADHQYQDIPPYVLAVLAKWGDSRVFPLVMLCLTDEDEKTDVRGMTLSRLAEVQATPIEDAVIAFVNTGKVEGRDVTTNRNVRADAIRLLGTLNSRKAIPLLRTIARDGSNPHSVAAVTQLGVLEAEEAIPDLLSILDRHPRHNKWCEATLALAAIGSPSTAERLIRELLGKQSHSHRVEVLERLGKVSAPKAYRMLEDTKLGGLESLPALEYFTQVAGKVNIDVQTSEAARQQCAKYTVVGQTGHTALSAFRHGVFVLNSAGYGHAIFLEEGRVNILTVEEAFAKWDAWLKDRPAK